MSDVFVDTRLVLNVTITLKELSFYLERTKDSSAPESLKSFLQFTLASTSKDRERERAP